MSPSTPHDSPSGKWAESVSSFYPKLLTLSQDLGSRLDVVGGASLV